jgi:methionine synthase II (cobalamin-independent)
MPGYPERHRFARDISTGVVDVHSHKIEDVDLIESRIEKPQKYSPKEVIWIDPDCDVKTCIVDEARAKLQNIRRGAAIFRKGPQQSPLP